MDSLNNVFGSINGILNSEAKTNLQQTIANLNKASNALNGLLDNQTGALAKTLNNAELLTRKLMNNTDDITATIKNAKITSDKLAALELQPTIDSLNEMISSMKAAVAKLKAMKALLVH